MTPPEMRARWERETRALIDAMTALEIDVEAASLLELAERLGKQEAWLL
jgi:hypothetical protein